MTVFARFMATLRSPEEGPSSPEEEYPGPDLTP